MAEAQYAPNHTIDPETGFLENNGYGYPFNAERKKQFIEAFVENGLGLYKTCKFLGVRYETVFNHLRQDEAFKRTFEEARKLYADDLDAISKQNARNPRSVIERIFQLKSLFPERYSDQRQQANVNVNVSLDGKLLETIQKRQEVIDIEPIPQESLDAKDRT